MRIPDRIVREPLPVDVMPRRVTPRLAWLDRLSWTVAVDVAMTYAELREDGWSADGAAECAGEGFVRWLTAKLVDAADVGLAFAQAGDMEVA